MKRYVVTGAPGAGKTAIIRQLEIDGFSIVEEAATDVIALWQAKGVTEPWTRPEFIDAILSLQQTRQRRALGAKDLVQFHDRSVVCTAALADYLGFRRSQNLVEELRRIRAENIFGLCARICKAPQFHWVFLIWAAGANQDCRHRK